MGSRGLDRARVRLRPYDPHAVPEASGADHKYVYLAAAGVVLPGSTYNGIVFDPTGLAFYVAGGPDDIVHIFTLSASTGMWGEAPNSPLNLGHGPLGGLGLNATSSGPVPINEQVSVTPCAAGVAISTDGKTLVVANFGNDSITVFNRGYGGATNWPPGTELDLRPGKSNAAQSGVPGGEYPFWVVVKGTGSSATAYVSSIRDREIVVVSLGATPAVTARIPVKGQPNKMTLNRAQSLLVCRRRPVGYRGRDRHHQERGGGKHPGNPPAFCASGKSL